MTLGQFRKLTKDMPGELDLFMPDNLDLFVD